MLGQNVPCSKDLFNPTRRRIYNKNTIFDDTKTKLKLLLYRRTSTAQSRRSAGYQNDVRCVAAASDSAAQSVDFIQLFLSRCAVNRIFFVRITFFPLYCLFSARRTRRILFCHLTFSLCRTPMLLLHPYACIHAVQRKKKLVLKYILIFYRTLNVLIGLKTKLY